MTTNNDLDQAREWAKWIIQADSQVEVDPDLRGAAEVIQSLPDEWIDADKLREFIQDWREGIAKYPGRGDGRAEEILATLENDFLIPQPRTLADTGWDDNIHPYMEALTISGRRHILLAPMGYTAVSENTILVAEHGGGVPVLVPAEALSPTGRYARLSLPDEEGRPEPVFDDLADDLTRTLKEMTREERETCRWMQADFDDGIAERPIRVVITKIYSNTADIILPDGATLCVYLYALTPLPDLPRMVWPDEHPAAVAEVVRLREALEVWRGKVKDIPYDGEAITAYITRILEGDANEQH